jgi:hypothetical protein
VLLSPSGGIGRIDGGDDQSGPGGHDRQPPAEGIGREAGDQVSELAVAAMALTRCNHVAESKILHGDRTDIRSSSKTDESTDRMTKLRVPVRAGTGEIEWDSGRLARWIARCVHCPASEVIDIEVDGYHAVAYGLLQGHRRLWCAGPGGIQVPASPLGTEPDGIGDSADRDLRGPLFSTMMKLH